MAVRGSPAGSDRPVRTPILAIVGQTASGKSELAMGLASTRPIEIVVADSRQVYRGMDVGTDKPNAAARTRVPHHLVDLVAADEPFTVAQWVSLARQAVSEIHARGRLPVVVGGTGLYVAALLDGHDYASQPWSPELRQRLTDELQAGGLASLADRLVRLDPATAARTDLDNAPRVVRALERAELGATAADVRATPPEGPVALIGIRRPREVLYRRIDDRARRMFNSDGLLTEVAALLAAGYGPQLRPMTGHGYREAARHLAGDWSLEQAIEVTARRTRQYAKRQLTWFQRDHRIRWVDAADGPAGAVEVVEAAAELADQLETVDSPID